MKYKFQKFQEGGEMPAEAPVAQEGAPAGEAPAGGNAEQAMAQMAQQLVDMLMQQIGDPQAVAAILQLAAEMAAGAAQGQAPTYQRNGGRVIRIK